MKINREELVKVLEVCVNAVAKKEAAEQMSHFIFTGKGIQTYDDKIHIFYPFKTEFTGSIKADTLLKTLIKMSAEEVDIDIDRDKNITVESKSIKLTKSELVEDEFVSEAINEIMEEVRGAEWKLLPENFIDAVTLCAFSASSEGTAGTLGAVYMNGNVIISSDSYRASIFILDEEIFNEPVMIDADAAFKLKPIKPTHYYVGDGWVAFQSEDHILFSTRRITGEYSEDSYRDLFDSFEGVTIKLPESIIEGATVTQIISGEVTLKDRQMNVQIHKNGVLCTAERETSIIEKRIECETNLTLKDKDYIEFVVNPEFLIQALDRTSLDIQISEKEKRAMFVSEDNKFLHLMSLDASG